MINKNETDVWPELDYFELRDTLATVHMWTQIVGKVRLSHMPWINHSWQVALYISSAGFSTGSVPYSKGIFEIELDFIQHKLKVSTSDGAALSLDLESISISSFYQKLKNLLSEAGITFKIYAVPNEVDPAIPFEENKKISIYDPKIIYQYWQVLVRVHNVFLQFRAGFIGKSSPVHLFWGAFDLAVTRFSGRMAPKHPGGAPNIPLKVMQEAYSHEVSSCGFWHGNDQFPEPSFYAYCYPAVATYAQQSINPEGAYYNSDFGEFILPYKIVQASDFPAQTAMKFLQSTYDAAANTGNWDTDLVCDLSYLKK